MASYTDEELTNAIDNRLHTDAGFRRSVAEAVAQRKRGFLSQLVIDVARMIFGSVISHLIDRAVDWLFSRL